LIKKLNLPSVHFLSIDRLERTGLVQRCGLTPTDLLHASGLFNRWEPQPAQEMVRIVSQMTQQSENELIPFLIDTIEQKLAAELLYNQLSQDVNVDSIADCQVCSHLVKQILSGNKSSYSIQANVNVPIIGIGAPIHYFLPKAGDILNAEIVIPENADVANALGAITSQILIRKKVLIRPNQDGQFLVEGVVGGKSFDKVQEAEEWTIEELKQQVLELGRLAGTSRKTVEISIDDSIFKLEGGESLFLGRTIQASLTGKPDLVIAKAS
jgi:N-methylhydantoinase A/oxoprolinase/acetone carboxylase beta subunit